MRTLFALLGVFLLVPHLSAQSSVTKCADGTSAPTGGAAACVGHDGVDVHKTPPAVGAAAGTPWLKPGPMDAFKKTVVRTRQLEMDAQSRDAVARRNEAAIREHNAASIAAAKAAPSAATLKKAAETEQNAGLASATSPGVSGSLGSSGGAKKARPAPLGTVKCPDGTPVPIGVGPGACARHRGVPGTGHNGDGERRGR